MDRLDDNYYHRKCYLERDQVPTQTVILNKMQPPLAKVYFKTMIRPLKVLAGLEPPLKGGGKVWYMPPDDLLQSRAVLKPVPANHLKYLGYSVIEKHSSKLVAAQKTRFNAIRLEAMAESDKIWKERIFLALHKTQDEQSRVEAQRNVDQIRHAFHEFTILYQNVITQLEENLLQVAIKKIEKNKQQKYQELKKKYVSLLNEQSINLYGKYEKMLMDEKTRLKAELIKNLQIARHDMGHKIHDINVDKHVALEKLRHLLECRNLACQVYVALKEREECKKEMTVSTHDHAKTVKHLKDTLIKQDFEIHLEIEKAQKRTEFKTVWKCKIACMVKKFQDFVAYCLRTLPEVADFFINMEKLMMLQIDVALDNPSVESIFIRSEDYLEPVAKPHPFRLFCDKGFKAVIDQNLCPKHCTSSATLLPALVINKKCMYAACDNYVEFSDKINKYLLHHQRGDDIDFQDDHNYSYDIPVSYSLSHHRRELKLESSLMTVLQKELVNLKEVDTECRLCKLPYCFHVDKQTSVPVVPSPVTLTASSISYGNEIKRSQELLFEREPKWGSYFDYVLPKKCVCTKIAKRHLQEHMPPYMRKTSKFEEPELLNYERCSVQTFKSLVRQVKERDIKISPGQTPVHSEVRVTVATQCDDPDFESICTCFSVDELHKFWNLMHKSVIQKKNVNKLAEDDLTNITPYLTRSMESFATERAHSLRRLICDSSELKNVFKGFCTDK